MKIIHIIGTRPQFIKVATLSRAIEEHNQNNLTPFIHEIFIHTGQHYDYEMNKIFFEELGLYNPRYHLNVDSGKHSHMTGQMLIRLEPIFIERKPDLVIVYGDCNSTLAGALTASKLDIPIAHVEAGVRSYNRRMPEEVNRVLTDHISNYLFCPTTTAVANLVKEGITAGLFQPGDVMYDSFANAVHEDKIIKSQIISKLQIKPDAYCLATIHRQENMEYLEDIFNFFEYLAVNKYPFIVPIHPRTKKIIEQNHWEFSPYIRFIPPVGYFDMLSLESNAKIILTDSGGVQKEAYFIGVPCVTVRDETEWPETIDVGWNFLSGVTDIIARFEQVIQHSQKRGRPNIFGDGRASKSIVKTLVNVL